MKLEHIDSFSCPSWAVSALYYGDYSGLSDEEAQMVTDFANEYPEGRYIMQFEDTPHFSQSPAFGLPCDCIDLLIYEITEETTA